MGIKRIYSLKHRKRISHLMKHGQRFKAFPVHMLAEVHDEEWKDMKVGFSVPARVHRSAVMRIRLKRRMRELVRPLIPQLAEAYADRGLSLMFIHVGPEESDFQLLQSKIN
ncbi:MAG: ribonuclease P protein component, partial [Bacteroidetes bacterium]|nr:ribonuclease P protein component [Bacteroidota bacterium]